MGMGVIQQAAGRETIDTNPYVNPTLIENKPVPVFGTKAENGAATGARPLNLGSENWGTTDLPYNPGFPTIESNPAMQRGYNPAAAASNRPDYDPFLRLPIGGDTMQPTVMPQGSPIDPSMTMPYGNPMMQRGLGGLGGLAGMLQGRAMYNKGGKVVK